MTLLGNNGILQNPAKFQFCNQEVDWSGFRITKDGVKPMPHIGFAHVNMRAELGVKTTKRLLRDNVSSNGKLDNLAVTKALLTYRNTLDRDTRLSPAFMLLGGNLRDFLPTKPFLLSTSDLSGTW